VIAPDFFEFGRSGRFYNRVDTLAIPRGPIDAVFPLPNFRARLLHPDVAQVTYNSAVTYNGVVHYARRSSIWSRTPSGWRLRFHQGTPYDARPSVIRRKAMKLDTPILFAATVNSKRARTFYEEALGLEFVADDPFALVFRVGRLQLRLQKVDRKPKINHTVLGWTVADIQKAVRHLSKAGVEFMRYDSLDQDADGVWQAPSGARVAWFRDPDDNTLSLTEYPR
jgi:catechol 2,3-dioxygenase-like lactoylglutathione lyase family enzyme